MQEENSVLLKKDVCFENKLFALYPKENVESKFVYYHYFSSIFQNDFKNQLTGIIGGVSIKKFKELKIPIPPLPEQKRIVSILDRAFEAIAKVKTNVQQNLKNTKVLFESYLNNIFEEKNIGQVCQVIAGQSPEGQFYNKNSNGLPFYQGKKEFTDKFIGKQQLGQQK